MLFPSYHMHVMLHYDGFQVNPTNYLNAHTHTVTYYCMTHAGLSETCSLMMLVWWLH